MSSTSAPNRRSFLACRAALAAVPAVSALVGGALAEPAFADTVPADEKVRDNEVEMARSLIDSLTEPWNPGAFTDEYREALLQIVEKKAAGEPIEAPSEEAPARVVDLMEALKASVAAAKDKTPSAGGARRSGAKRSSAKKPAAKRAPSAKKTTTRKKASGE